MLVRTDAGSGVIGTHRDLFARPSAEKFAVCLALLTLLVVPAPVWARHHARHPVPAESCSQPRPPQTTVALTGAQATVDFSPDGGGRALILQVLAAARHHILVQAYSFSDRRILAALSAAKARGVDVRVILDKSDTESYEHHQPVAAMIAAQGIPVWIDDSVRIAHNKVMIIDGTDLITGSYNFTYSAAYANAENLLYLRNAPALVQAYTADWYWRQSCSRTYTGP
jgi:phosphatidylserine/phosphatidylglycerophosphate/cardiolipin synthase-like enzyme